MKESYYLNIPKEICYIGKYGIYLEKFPEEIIKGDNITESGFNYEEEYEKEFIKGMDGHCLVLWQEW